MRAATFALARTGRRALTTGSGPQLHRTSFYDHATTILSVRKGNEVVMIGDGQVTRGSTVVKPNARKVRRIGGGKVVVGFAGTAADGLALLEHLEAKLEEYPNQLMRASVAMAKMWRTDKYLRHLEALMIACDKDVSLTITGNGDVLEPHDGVIAIGSGADFASSAARALLDLPEFNAMQIAEKAMRIAAESCIYTNSNFVVESIALNPPAPPPPTPGRSP